MVETSKDAPLLQHTGESYIIAGERLGDVVRSKKRRADLVSSSKTVNCFEDRWSRIRGALRMTIRCAMDIEKFTRHGAMRWRAGERSEFRQSRTRAPSLCMFAQSCRSLAYYDLKYLIGAKGSLEIEVSFKPFSDSTPPLPRLGLIAGLAGDLQRVTWYGRGPHETHWDRKTGAKLAATS